MFRSLVALLALIMLLSLCALIAPQQASAGGQSRFLPGEILIKLTQSDYLESIASDYGLDPAPIDQFGSRPIYRLRITDGASPRDKAAQLTADPQMRVIYAEPDFEAEAPEGRGRVRWAVGESAAAYADQWASLKIRLPEAHTVTSGAGIIVAVLDTGVDFSHPSLIGKLLPGFDFVDLDKDPSEVGDHEQNIAFGHGTHVAALVALVAPDSMIMPVRVLDPDGRGNIWVLAEALAYAIDPDGNPDTDDGAQVINLSLSSLEQSHLIRDVLKAITCAEPLHVSQNDLPCFLGEGRGAVVVAAAGNNGSSKPEYPAGEGIKGTISVGASSQTDMLAFFSNYGSWVRVEAPGENIISAVPGGFAAWSGTSMAVPLVSGQAALVRAAFPALNTSNVVERIILTSAKTSSLVRLRIDAAAAVGLERAK